MNSAVAPNIPTSSSLETRIDEAKAFLKDHPEKKIAYAARKFQLHLSTLYNSISRDKKPRVAKKIGGYNKILEAHQVEAVHKFIRSLLAYGIQPSPGVVFNAILGLKRAQNPEKKDPTKRWFSTWWKSSNLHMIKSKPLAVERFTAAQETDVRAWFSDYKKILRALQIKNKRDIINFDEAGFRVGCMKGHKLIVPKDVSTVYTVSPENRKSVTIFECIDAAGHYPPPPMIIIKGFDMMASWFPEGLPDNTHVIPSEKGFTNDQITLEFLRHYIRNSDSGPDANWKLMLMDNHGSHCTPEFIALANENHIRPYPLIAHLTHCMQPLDVGVFQPYKHWHDMAIQDALLEFSIEYKLTRFLGDLTKIRDNTFKKGTIQHAFEKSGMWPINPNRCVEQLKTFAPRDASELPMNVDPTSLPAPLPRVLPTSLMQVESGLEAWQEKIQRRMNWSDPVQPEEFESFIDSSKKVFSEATFNDTQLSIFRKRREEDLQAKTISRKRLHSSGSGLGLTKEKA